MYSSSMGMVAAKGIFRAGPKVGWLGVGEKPEGKALRLTLAAKRKFEPMKSLGLIANVSISSHEIEIEKVFRVEKQIYLLYLTAMLPLGPFPTNDGQYHWTSPDSLAKMPAGDRRYFSPHSQAGKLCSGTRHDETFPWRCPPLLHAQASMHA